MWIERSTPQRPPRHVRWMFKYLHIFTIILNSFFIGKKKLKQSNDVTCVMSEKLFVYHFAQNSTSHMDGKLLTFSCRPHFALIRYSFIFQFSLVAACAWKKTWTIDEKLFQLIFLLLILSHSLASSSSLTGSSSLKRSYCSFIPANCECGEQSEEHE